MTEEEEQEVIFWGNKAKALCEDQNFVDLCLFIQVQISNQIMASPLQAKDFREDLFIEHAGLRSFANKLANLAGAAQDILKARDEDISQQSSDYDEDE